MLRVLLLAFCSAGALFGGAASAAGGTYRAAEQVHALQDDLDSLVEEVDDLREPIGELELFEECAYPVGVSEEGDPRGRAGYLYGSAKRRRPALRLDIRGFGTPDFQFLAFPAEEPPSIECNEDAGQEDTD